MARIVWHSDMCQSHGQCQIASEGLFRLVADFDVEFPEVVTDDQLDAAWAAADACPMQAITIEEDR